MTAPITDEERDFIWYHQGSIMEIVSGGAGAIGAANDAADVVVTTVVARYPNRAERVLALAALARAFTESRNDVLRDLLASQYHEQGYRMSGFMLEHLAELSGMSLTTLRRWDKEEHKKWWESTKAAKENAGAEPNAD